jgi:hypothetical protein
MLDWPMSSPHTTKMLGLAGAAAKVGSGAKATAARVSPRMNYLLNLIILISLSL